MDPRFNNACMKCASGGPVAVEAGRVVPVLRLRMLYTLFFDNSNLTDEAAKQAVKERRRTQFMRGLNNMQIRAEGGTLPPRPAPPGREEATGVRVLLAPIL